jgi:hypothetical protein
MEINKSKVHEYYGLNELENCKRMFLLKGENIFFEAKNDLIDRRFTS